MISAKRISFTAIATLALISPVRPAFAGLIVFNGDSSLVSALGKSLSTGVNTLAIGQTVTIPFSATVTGVESVSGSVVLSSTATGGTVELSNVVFTVLGSTSTNASFGLAVTQAFAYSGPSDLGASLAANATSHITQPSGPLQPGDALISASITTDSLVRPDSGGSGTGFAPTTRSNFGFGNGSYPLDLDYDPYSASIPSGIIRTTTKPVTLVADYSTNISAFNSYTGSGTSTTLQLGTYSFNAAAVPEPASVTLLVFGGLGLMGIIRRTQRQNFNS